MTRGTQSLNRLEFRDRRSEDIDWFERAVQSLGGPMIVSNDTVYDARDHTARIAWHGAKPVGLSVYRRFDTQTLEVLAFKASVSGQGVGSALLKDLVLIAGLYKIGTIVLDTTNDNIRALRFYERNGFTVNAWRHGAFRRVLALKGMDPDTVLVGDNDIEIRDVLRLEKTLPARGLFR